MTVFAIQRPSDWEWPLLAHVSGAMLLVGSLVVALALALASRRGGGSASLVGAAFRTLAYGALPAWLLMRVGAEWILSKQNADDETWVGIGYMTSESALLLILGATVCAWRASRLGEGRPGWLTTAVTGLTGLVLVMFVVTIWAMSAKPA